MSQLFIGLRYCCLSFNDHGQQEITVTPHLTEAIKQKVISNSAKGFNEVRSHIKIGMLSKISFNLPMKTSVNGGPAVQKYPLWLWWLTEILDFFSLCFNFTWFERKQPQKTQAVVAPVRM